MADENYLTICSSLLAYNLYEFNKLQINVGRRSIHEFAKVNESLFS